MKPKPFQYLFFILFPVIMGMTACNDIIEPSISKKQVILEAPADQFQSSSYTINFWWDEVENALSYHLQVVTPNFASPGSLVLDTIVTKNKFSFTLSPGNYQWRVMAENSSSQTVYTAPKSFSVFPKDQVYQWRVRAENDTAQALWSAINVITYDHTPPAQVSVTSPADSTFVAQPVSLRWKAVITAAKYKLYLYKSDGTTLFSSAFPVTVAATNYSFNQGASGDKLYWKVSGVDAAANEGTASALISFTLQ